MKPFRPTLIVCGGFIAMWFLGFYVGHNESISERKQPAKIEYHTNTLMVPVERSELDLTISNATDHAVNVYLPGKPDKWGMRGSQDRYIDWPYPPLRTNLTQYEIIPGHGTAFIYFCNDGQLRWSFKPVKQ